MTDIIVTTLTDELDAEASVEAPGGDGLSLREALSLAADGDPVLFADNLNGTIRLDETLSSNIGAMQISSKRLDLW